jgi:cytochrome P450
VEHQAQLGNPDDHGAAFGRLAAFGLAEVESRRKQPRDDYLTALGQATLDGKLLEPEQIATIMISLLAAGHETSTLLMASMFYEVLSRPVIRDQLIADPSLISPAVEEVLRLHPPVMGLYRRTSEAVTVQGVEIAGGSDVMLCYAAGNRDPKVFDEPNEFRLDRKRNRHLTFGFGTHSCLGAPVARLEMRLGLAEVLRRLPDIELVDKDLAYQFTGPEFVALPALRAKFTPET